MKRTDEQLTNKTLKIIRRDGRIVLRKRRYYVDAGPNGPVYERTYDTYLHQSTDIAAGWDKAGWVYHKARIEAKVFSDLKTALTIAPLYGCKVIVLYPKRKQT